MIIELDPQTTSTINQYAKAQGISAEQWVKNTINQHIKKERPFNFDIDELDKAINSGFVAIPNFDTVEQLAGLIGWCKRRSNAQTNL